MQHLPARQSTLVARRGGLPDLSALAHSDGVWTVATPPNSMSLDAGKGTHAEMPPRRRPRRRAATPPRQEPLKLKIGGTERQFDIEDPELPDWVEKRALKSGDYPYNKKLDIKEYEETLERLQIELVKMLAWMQANGKRAHAACSRGATRPARAARSRRCANT